jgi:hypothetical protein
MEPKRLLPCAQEQPAISVCAEPNGNVQTNSSKVLCNVSEQTILLRGEDR